MSFLTDLFFNMDVVLKDWALQYGFFLYVILFLIIFLETGLVVTPFLPGDSLLFAAGAVAAISDGGLEFWVLLVLLFAAAVTGDFVNYWVGRFWGRRILDSGRLERVVKPHHIQRTEAFFARHGGKTISFARFFPFIRTFAPFVAGISKMDLRRFVAFNILGGACWVGLFVTAGYFFGTIPFVHNNLQYLAIGIILLTVMPGVVHYVRERIRRRRRRAQGVGDCAPERAEVLEGSDEV